MNFRYPGKSGDNFRKKTADGRKNRDIPVKLRRDTIVKIILVLFLAFFLGSVYLRTFAKDVSLSEIDKSFSVISGYEKLKKQDARRLYQFTGLNAGDYDEVLYRKNTDTMGVEELLIVKAYAAEDVDDVRRAAETRIKEQTRVFEGYGPEQTALLKNAVIYTRDRYLFYCVAESPEKYEEVFKNAL